MIDKEGKCEDIWRTDRGWQVWGVVFAHGGLLGLRKIDN